MYVQLSMTVNADLASIVASGRSWKRATDRAAAFFDIARAIFGGWVDLSLPVNSRLDFLAFLVEVSEKD